MFLCLAPARCPGWSVGRPGLMLLLVLSRSRGASAKIQEEGRKHQRIIITIYWAPLQQKDRTLWHPTKLGGIKDKLVGHCWVAFTRVSVGLFGLGVLAWFRVGLGWV